MANAANFGGIEIDASLAEQTFYGIRLDINGHMIVDVIPPGDGSIVSLPDGRTIRPTDYKVWFWSEAALDFEIVNGRLIMVIL